MTTCVLRPNQFIELDGVTYHNRGRVRRISDGKHAYQLYNDTNGEFTSLTDEEFRVAWAAGRLRLVDDPRAERFKDPALAQTDFARMPKSMRDGALVKRRLLAACEANPGMRSHAELAALAEEVFQNLPAELLVLRNGKRRRPPAPRTLSAWLSEWAGTPAKDVRMLAPLFHLRGPTKRRMHPQVHRELTRFLEQDVMSGAEFLARDVHARLARSIEKFNADRVANGLEAFKVPSERTIRRAINDMDQDGLLAARKGRRIAKLAFQPVLRGDTADEVMEVVQLDHTLGDVRLVDGEGVELGRPWISIAIDLHSRCIVGWRVGFEGESTAALLALLRHVMTPKSGVETLDGLLADNPCWGVPQTVVLDHAAAHKSAAFVEACLHWDISREYTFVKRPQKKGVVERVIQTVNRQACRNLPGRSGPDTVGREEDGTIGLPVVTLAEFGKRLNTVIAVYNNTEHRGLKGLIPLEVWKRGEARREPRRPASMMDVQTLLALPGRSQATREGVRWKNLRWNGEAIRAIRAQHPPSHQVMVDWKLDVDDIRTLLVADPRTGQYAAVELQEPRFDRPVRLSEWEQAEKARREGREAADKAGLAARKSERNAAIDALAKQAKEAKEAAKRSRSTAKQKRQHALLSQGEPDASREAGQAPEAPAAEPDPVPVAKARREAGTWAVKRRGPAADR